MAHVSKQARNTKQLEVIWAALRHDKSHPTADQVYQKVRRKLPNISLGTVYRNLQKLVAENRLQVLILGRSQHFDPLVERHQHFICERCEQVYDVLVDHQKEIKPAKLPHEGFKVTSHQLAFYGTCKECSR
ncbi:MAG: transcriptional repressor [Deltaproteobacteria bacterium]|nr:transcriptional repressor [Deltaproteobacteria bacterium]